VPSPVTPTNTKGNNLPTREELFAPKGVKPQWEMVYDIFKPLAEDDVLTYEEARVKLDERQKHIERVVKEHREEALESITDVNERVEKMREALRRHNIDIEI
jgi:hypothetical protein